MLHTVWSLVRWDNVDHAKHLIRVGGEPHQVFSSGDNCLVDMKKAAAF
jgi:hypothetical protein